MLHSQTNRKVVGRCDAFQNAFSFPFDLVNTGLALMGQLQWYCNGMPDSQTNRKGFRQVQGNALLFSPLSLGFLWQRSSQPSMSFPHWPTGVTLWKSPSPAFPGFPSQWLLCPLVCHHSAQVLSRCSSRQSYRPYCSPYCSTLGRCSGRQCILWWCHALEK